MAIPARQLVARGVGDKVRAYRQALGWSQERLARETDPPLTRQTIYTIEAGTNFPEWETLERIAEALEIAFWELLPERLFFVASGRNEAEEPGKWVARESNPEPTDLASVALITPPYRGDSFTRIDEREWMQIEEVA